MLIRRFVTVSALALSNWAMLCGETPGGQGFLSPRAAAKALVSAVRNSNTEGILKILGSSASGVLITNDPVADENSRKDFVKRANEKIRVVSDPGHPSRRIVEVGVGHWPLPIPLVKTGGKWYFDVSEGTHQILLRRIGDNELTAMNVCQGFVEAEFTYAETNAAGTGHPQYAQKFISSAGAHDGLYWKSEKPNDESPIGDLVAHALAEGYTDKSKPYHGYYFKVLKGQGPHAPGGAMSYLDNQAMTKGFAVVAWPSEYKVTGVMTFQVDRTGILFQKDLGTKTADIAGAIADYDPDQTWVPVATSGGSSR